MKSSGALVGFARLITYITPFSYLCDVFVVEAYKQRRLSKWLIQIIHAHPDLQNLRRWMLGIRHAHGLFAQFGREILPEDISKRSMRLHNTNVYVKDETNFHHRNKLLNSLPN